MCFTFPVFKGAVELQSHYGQNCRRSLPLEQKYFCTVGCYYQGASWPHHVVAICFDGFKTMPLSPLVVRESLIIIIVVVMASDKRHIWVQRQIISCLQTFTFLPRSYFFFHKDDISFQLTINQLQLVHCYTIFHLRSGLCTIQRSSRLCNSGPTLQFLRSE